MVNGEEYIGVVIVVVCDVARGVTGSSVLCVLDDVLDLRHALLRWEPALDQVAVRE